MIIRNVSRAAAVACDATVSWLVFHGLKNNVPVLRRVVFLRCSVSVETRASERAAGGRKRRQLPLSGQKPCLRLSREFRGVSFRRRARERRDDAVAVLGRRAENRHYSAECKLPVSDRSSRCHCRSRPSFPLAATVYYSTLDPRGIYFVIFGFARG